MKKEKQSAATAKAAVPANKPSAKKTSAKPSTAADPATTKKSGAVKALVAAKKPVAVAKAGTPKTAATKTASAKPAAKIQTAKPASVKTTAAKSAVAKPSADAKTASSKTAGVKIADAKAVAKSNGAKPSSTKSATKPIAAKVAPAAKAPSSTKSQAKAASAAAKPASTKPSATKQAVAKQPPASKATASKAPVKKETAAKSTPKSKQADVGRVDAKNEKADSKTSAKTPLVKPVAATKPAGASKSKHQEQESSSATRGKQAALKPAVARDHADAPAPAPAKTLTASKPSKPSQLAKTGQPAKAAVVTKVSSSDSAKADTAKKTTAELVKKPVEKRSAAKAVKPEPKKPALPPPPPVSAKSQRIRREMAMRAQRAAQNKDISTGVLVGGAPVRSGGSGNGSVPHKDRIVLLVRDCYWLQAEWEITKSAVERVRVAMAEKWHNAIPVLRLMSVADATANSVEQTVKDMPIHGGVSSWYVDVDEPPSRFRVVIGYVSDNDRFFPICRSNVVETPRPGAANRIDEHWRDIAEDYERIYSLSGGMDASGAGDDLKEMFEERLQRTMPSRPDGPSAGSDTDAALDRHRALPFEVDAEMIIYGSTVPGATVMLGGEPIKLRPDGSFTIRVALPDKRQVFPVIAQSRDGMRQRTTVVAVERNTKVMEAVDRDSNF